MLGLHSVFEHHAVMGPEALKVFVHEYRIAFPIGIDRPNANGGVPNTMHQFGLKGTPSLIVLDRQGAVRLHHFGRAADMAVGALIGQLVAEGASAVAAAKPVVETHPQFVDAKCGDDACPT